MLWPQVSLLQEPVAAGMAFGFGKPFDAELLLVFDLGGGTCDLSLVDSFEGIMEVRRCVITVISIQK
jgi:molecular chaperone HscC